MTLPESDGAYTNAVFFDLSRGWIAAGQNGLVGTSDGGKTWTNSSKAPATIDYLVSTPRGILWATGRSYEVPGTPIHVLSVSKDQGASWTEAIRVVGSQTFLGSVWFLDDSHGWVVGSSNGAGAVWATSDGGNSWSLSFADRERVLDDIPVDLRFTNSRDGWMITAATVAKTSDGGRTWSITKSFPKTFFRSIEITTAGTIWVTGGWNVLLSSTDKGSTWIPAAIPRDVEVYLGSVRFFGNRGWVSGSDSTLLSSSDGGRSWHRESLPLPEDTGLSSITVTPQGDVLILTDGPSLVWLKHE